MRDFGVYPRRWHEWVNKPAGTETNDGFGNPMAAGKGE